MSTQRFPLPDVGEGLAEAEIVEWRVAVGDTVAVNQVVVEIETAKSLVELPSPWSGKVSALLAEPGTMVDVGTPIIEIATGAAASAAAGVDTDEDGPAPGGSGSVLVGYGTGGGSQRRRRRRSATAPSDPAGDHAPPRDVPHASPDDVASPRPRVERALASVPIPASTAGGARVLAKPPVRKLAKDLGVDLTTVAPTGQGGIVTREDVVARAERTTPDEPVDRLRHEPGPTPGTPGSGDRQTRVPVRSVRKHTADAMVASAFTAPHVTVFHTVDVTRTMRLVKALKEDRDFADVRVTPLLVAAKAVLLALGRHPQVNASWDDAAQEIVYKHYVNLGIAAATPRGLMVPNVKDAHVLDLHGLAHEITELTATARTGRTTPRDMSDGTFTITNIGVFGIDTGTPILNPGEAGILAFGAIRKQPWVHKGKVRPRWVTQLALSFDHRLVDGELGSRFLSDVARVLEDPARGLVWG